MGFAILAVPSGPCSSLVVLQWAPTFGGAYYIMKCRFLQMEAFMRWPKRVARPLAPKRKHIPLQPRPRSARPGRLGAGQHDVGHQRAMVGATVLGPDVGCLGAKIRRVEHVVDAQDRPMVRPVDER